MSNLPFDFSDDFVPATQAEYLPPEHLAIFPGEYPAESLPLREKKLHELSLVLHQPDIENSASAVPRYTAESNQRQYSRCAVAEERTNAVLSMNGRQFNCRVVELSIGGFGVVIPGQPKFDSGTVGKLRAPGLNYIVRVSRQERREGGTYIGLSQLEEVVDHNQSPGHTSTTVGYLIAGLAGAFVAVTVYCFMAGT